MGLDGMPLLIRSLLAHKAILRLAVDGWYLHYYYLQTLIYFWWSQSVALDIIA